MKKKVIALLLSTVVAAGMLTGCGSGTADKPQEAAQSREEVPGAEADQGSAAQDQTSAEAGDGDNVPAEKELVKLRMVMYGDMTTRREEFFKKEFHDAVLEDLNIDLSVEFLAWGSDKTTVANMLASGEAFAVWNIISSNDWDAKGYLAEIDEALIDERCPDLIRVRTENNGFECCKFNGKIYAIPFGAKPYAGRMQTFQVRNDILKQVGMEASQITTYEQLMEACAAVKEKFPQMRIVRGAEQFINILNSEVSDQLISTIDGMKFAYVDELEDNDTVYSLYESEAFQNLCKIAEDWVEKGYINMDVLSNPGQEIADWDAGNCLLCYGTPGGLIDTSTASNIEGVEYDLIKIGDLPLTKSRDYDWGFSISASDAANVDRWLDLFNWMYKDEATYNFCIYGVEGKDWERTEEGGINKLVEDSFFDGWFMEAMEYVVYDPALSKEAIEKYESNDNGSLLSKTAGFSFDSTNVASELAGMTAVWTEMIQPLRHGLLSFDDNYEKAIQQLKDAGLDAYMEEYQKQYSAWYAENRG